MTELLLLLFLSTGILLFAMLASDILFRRSPQKQDVIWRSTLVVLALMPVLLWLRPSIPQQTVFLPMGTSPVFSAALTTDRNLISSNRGVLLDSTPVATARPASPFSSTESAAPIPTTTRRTTQTETATKTSAVSDVPMASSPETITQSTPGMVAPAVAATSWIEIVSWIFACTWSAGAAIQCLILACGYWRYRQRLGDLQPVSKGRWLAVLEKIHSQFVRRCPPLAFSSKIATPQIHGLLRPQLIIPVTLKDSPQQDVIQQVLVHELTHLKRGDQWSNALLSGVGVMLWAHPLYYWMRRRIYWLREIACDAQVVKGRSAVDYAETLLMLSRTQHQDISHLALGMTIPRSVVGRRIAHLLTQSELGIEKMIGLTKSLAWLIAVTICVAICCVRFSFAGASSETKLGEISSEIRPSTISSEKGTTVSGRITLPNGQPADQAVVYLLSVNGDSLSLPTHPAKTKSNSSGRYQFDDVQPGNYRIWSETNQLTTLERSLAGQPLSIEAKDDSLKDVDLTLHEGCTYQVTVTDMNQNPIADADISFGWTDIDRHYTTNKKGEVEIGGLAMNEWYFVVKAKGYGIVYRKLPKFPLGTETPVSFELKPGVNLEGTVTDLNGIPVPDARVTVREETRVLTPGLGQTTTDSFGRYQLDSIPTGMQIQIDAFCEDHKRFSQDLVIPAFNEKKIQQDIHLERLPYGGDCVVTIVDQKGAPIEGAKLTNMGRSSADVRTADSDKRGEALLENIYQGSTGARAVVHAPGFIPQAISLVAGSPDEPGRVTVELTPGESIRGRLLKPDGSAAAGVRVYFNDGEHGPFENLGGVVKTDREGRFQIDGLPDPSTFTFYTPNSFAPINDLELPVGQADEVIVTMSPQSVIRVVAIDSKTKKRIPEFNVKVQHCNTNEVRDATPGILTRWSVEGFDIPVTEKEFKLGNLQADMLYQLTVSAKGYLPKIVPRAVSVTEDESEPIHVELRSETEVAFTKVAGKLVDTNGKAISHAKIYLAVAKRRLPEDKTSFYAYQEGYLKENPDCLQFLTTVCNKDGEFEFDHVRAEAWMEIVFEGDNIAIGRYYVEGDDLIDLEIKAELPGAVKVKFDREEFPNVQTISISSNQVSRNETIVSTKSEFEFERLPPGDYQINLHGPAEQSERDVYSMKNLASKKLSVAPDSKIEVSFGGE